MPETHPDDPSHPSDTRLARSGQHTSAAVDGHPHSGRSDALARAAHRSTPHAVSLGGRTYYLPGVSDMAERRLASEALALVPRAAPLHDDHDDLRIGMADGDPRSELRIRPQTVGTEPIGSDGPLPDPWRPSEAVV